MTITIKNETEIRRMEEAGQVVGLVHSRIERAIVPGISTADLDDIARETLEETGAVSSFLGYHGFTGTICASINDEVVHGIPSRKRKLREGDIISLDCGAIFEGWHGDGARTFVVGKPAPEVESLVEATRLAMMAGIAAAVPGGHLGDISAAIEDVAAPHGYGIVRQFVGHGIGTEMHQEPQVPNYRTGARGMKLAPGICLAIEPMLTLGSHEVEVKPDGWTVVTPDGSLAAHFEHTIAVTDHGPEILTTV